MKKIFLGLIAITCYSCIAQHKKANNVCNQNSSAKWIENELPETICIEKDEMIYNLFNEFDFNNDELFDIAIEKGSEKLRDGEQVELVFFKKINDSTFTKFRTFKNIYPVWFNEYDSSDKLEDSTLNEIKNTMKWEIH